MSKCVACSGFGLLVFLATFFTSSVNAATITYSGDSGVVAPQFDPHVGSLSGVTYSVSGEFLFTLSHNAPFAIYPIYNVSKGFTLNGTGLTWKDPGGVPGIDAFVNVGWNSPDLLQPGEVYSQTASLDYTLVPDLGLAPFIGTGLVNAGLALSEDSDLCYSEDLFPFGDTYHMDCGQIGKVTVSMTYDYTPAGGTPVPEPSTAILLGFGLFVTAASTARRRGFRASVPRP